MKLTLGSTYSGAIDAFAYAAEKLNDLGAARYEVLWQIEKERQAHRYLKQNHPNAKRYYFDEWFEQYQLQPVDIICGGDPCQPHSNAGVRLGTEDDRFRWPVMFKLIEALRPNWILTKMLLAQSVTWYSTKRLLIWRKSATPANRTLYQLSPLMPITKGAEFSLLPTPMFKDGESYYVLTMEQSLKRVHRQIHWGHQAMLFYNLNKAWANPHFSLWLMGYPTKYLDLEQQVTQSCLPFQ